MHVGSALLHPACIGSYATYLNSLKTRREERKPPRSRCQQHNVSTSAYGRPRAMEIPGRCFCSGGQLRIFSRIFDTGYLKQCTAVALSIWKIRSVEEQENRFRSHFKLQTSEATSPVESHLNFTDQSHAFFFR